MARARRRMGSEHKGRQLQDAFGRPAREPGQSDRVELDYDDVVQQSFPASDPPPPPDGLSRWNARASGSVRMDLADGLGGPKRGTTFGYTEPQFDGHPTLADLGTKTDGNPDGLHRSVGKKAADRESPERGGGAHREGHR